MKVISQLLAVCLIIAFACKLSAQSTTNSAPAITNVIHSLKISTAEATNYYDTEMIVTGKVVQVTIRPTVTFINLDKPFPNSPFAVVIVHKRSSFYGDANALKGKTIEVKGAIKEYNGKPEMMLDSTNQLIVVGVTNLELFLKPKISATATNAPATNAAPQALQATNLSEIM